jgi:hypothetical protein
MYQEAVRQYRPSEGPFTETCSVEVDADASSAAAVRPSVAKGEGFRKATGTHRDSGLRAG